MSNFVFRKFLFLSLWLFYHSAYATGYPESPSWGRWEKWGSQPDGTYFNPVLPADFSDIDCIRVGEDYYAISSTFQYSPGMVILHSRNLVDWKITGHAVTDIRKISPEMNWDRIKYSCKSSKDRYIIVLKVNLFPLVYFLYQEFRALC